MTRVPVITGAGAVTAFGAGLPVLLRGLAEGRGAVSRIRSFDVSRFPVQVAGEVPPEAVLAASRDRKVGFALQAAREAWLSAACGPEETRATLSLAVGLEQAFLEDFSGMLSDGHLEWSREPPGARFRSSADDAGRAVHADLGLSGPTIAHVSACAAGGLAIAHAASLVARGAADVVVCGGADSMLNPLGLGGMWRLGAPSPRASPDACRPFDRRRDGLVIGEGAAVFVVEDEARACARGARPLCRILGWGSTQDAWRVTAPRPDGASARAAIERCLSRARLSPEEIGYVNAHGTGTPLNDPAECRALRGALGAAAERVPVSSIKGAVGHLMAASGAVELAACLLAFQRDLLPGTANHAERDPECELDIIGQAPRSARIDVVLSNSFGFGGQNVTLALGRVA